MSAVLLTTLSASRFSSVFTAVDHMEKRSLSNPCQLRLYHLAVASNSFIHEDLKDFLKLNLGCYANSRAQLEQSAQLISQNSIYQRKQRPRGRWQPVSIVVWACPQAAPCGPLFVTRKTQ